jgi:very-short-patch-repair endonuclease
LNNPFTPYSKNLKTNSRTLRTNSTLSEVLLWNELKAGKLKGYKFNRQKPIGNFIVDFYCRKLALVIEVDGDSHTEREIEDLKRATKIENLGLNILRFEDIEVKHALDSVLKKLKDYVDQFEVKVSTSK